MSKTNKIFVFLILCNLVLVAGLGSAFWYLKEKNSEISTWKNEVKVFKDRASKVRSISQLLEETRSEREVIDSFFVSDERVVSFIENLEALARQRGLVVSTDSIQVQDIEKSNLKQNLQVQLNTIGNWNNTFHFFKQVENLPVGLKVDSVSLNKNTVLSQEADTVSHEWRMSLRLSVSKIK